MRGQLSYSDIPAIDAETASLRSRFPLDAMHSAHALTALAVHVSTSSAMEHAQLNIWQHPSARLRVPDNAPQSAPNECAVAMSIGSSSAPSAPPPSAAAAAPAAAAYNEALPQQTSVSDSLLGPLTQASAAESSADDDAHSHPQRSTTSSTAASNLSPQEERPKKRKARCVRVLSSLCVTECVCVFTVGMFHALTVRVCMLCVRSLFCVVHSV